MTSINNAIEHAVKQTFRDKFGDLEKTLIEMDLRIQELEKRDY